MRQPAQLENSDKKYLLNLARRTLESLPDRGAGLPKEASPEEEDVPERLRIEQGAFVTLHTLPGDLRGCIGYVEPVAPLYRTVMENTVNAARRDPRFTPVEPDEVESIRIEISAMSPPQPIGSVEEIEVGRHGLIISQGLTRGLLLPQVATEYDWDRQTFLEHTCLKAGLSPDAWKDDRTRIEAFSADVFSE
jgi:AmmeMemoRadiSam system protein A